MKTLNTVEYFKLNENGELDVFFTGIKKELHVPAKVVKSSSNTIASNTNSNIYVEKIQREKLQLIDGGVGVGKSTLMLKETIKTMLAGGFVVFGVHKIETLTERALELETEIQKYIDAGKKKAATCGKAKEKLEKLELLLTRIKQVSSKDLDRGVTVGSMFDNVVNELKNDNSTGACIFVTNVAVRFIDVSFTDNNKDLLVMDDDITPYIANKPFEKHTLTEVKLVKECFKIVSESNENSTYFKVDGKANQFEQLINIIQTENKTNSKFTAAIKSVANVIERETNNDHYLRVSKNKEGSYNIELFSKLSQNILNNFKNVYALSENIKTDNTAVATWLREGIKYDYTMLTYDTEKRGKKFLYGADGKPMIKVASIAGENKFSISKATSESGKNGYGLVSDYINGLGSMVDSVMISKNSRVADNAFNAINSPFDVCSTVTRGRNDLMHNNVMLNYGLNKVDNNTGSFLNELYDVKMDELNSQVTISAQVQNIGRGALRKTQTKPVVLVFPDNATARESMIRYAKSYPELQPFIDELLSNIDVINEGLFKNEKKVYEDEKTRKRVNYLKSVHGEENVQQFIDQHGVNTAIDYFGKLAMNDKELKKQVTAIARKVKKLVKPENVKKAAQLIGELEFTKRVNGLKGKAIVELVNNTIAGGVTENVSETVQETVSLNPPAIEKRESTFANFKAKMKQNKIDDRKSNFNELELPSMDHGKDNQDLASVNFMDSVDNTKTAFNFGEQLKSTAFTMSSIH
ncbi:hypothetical protein [Pseudoalteromonas sp. Q18-MNA-CIBAN-0097]|uniref:hypothetical protein n=1 Tax=Pseudoalteromonas sp. Q18-MNA-CIBAN-0097 TaxID=3140440 RepID=UPI00331DB600